MLNKLLIPLDGSGIAEAPLRATRPLLSALGAELDLLTALPDADEHTPEHFIGAAGLYLSHQMLVGAFERYHARLIEELSGAGLTAAAALGEGDPTEAILARLDSDAALAGVAMTTHGRWGLGHPRLGKVAASVLSRSDKSLLFVPSSAGDRGPASDGKFARVMLAVDVGSPALGAGKETVVHVVERLGAALQVMVVEQSSDRSTVPDETSQQVLDACKAELGGAGVDVTPILRRGPRVAQVIAENAVGEEADLLIVVGGTGEDATGVVDWLFSRGDQTDRLLAQVEMPVLVVRSGGDAS